MNSAILKMLIYIFLKSFQNLKCLCHCRDFLRNMETAISSQVVSEQVFSQSFSLVLGLLSPP